MNAPDPGARLSRHTETIYESLMRNVLVAVKEMRKPWKNLSESEQESILAVFDHGVKEAIRRGVEVIAAEERPNIVVELESVVFKDEIKAVCKMPREGSSRHELADCVGNRVLLVIAKANSHTDGERPAPEPDQGNLALGKTMDDAFKRAETEDEEEVKRKAEEEAKLRKETEEACIAAFHATPFEVTAEDVAGWTVEEITEARAFIAAYESRKNGDKLPVPPHLQGKRKKS